MEILDDIRKKVEDWTYEHISSSFVFRPNQEESIVNIIYNITNKNIDTTIVQAPTGTGKSLICIICAGVLSSYYDMKSYILASDLYLWEQYMAAMNKYHLKDFGYLKGSIGNYRCDMNHLDYNTGKCKINKISINMLRNRDQRHSLGYDCADTCLYMRHRFRAEKTPVTLLTYQLWLYQMNLVEHEENNKVGFLPRDVIFCDECHNIPDIVQMYAQPVIDAHNDREKLLSIIAYAMDNEITCSYEENCFRPDVIKKFENENVSLHNTKISDITTPETVISNFDYFINCLIIANGIDHRNSIKLDILKEYCRFLNFINSVSENCMSYMNDNKSANISDSEDNETYGKKRNSNKEKIANYKLFSWMHGYYSMISEFLNAVTSTGSENIVIEENIDKQTNNMTFNLNCVKEDYLCYKYLLKNAKYKVMTSATVGNHDAYADNIGAKLDKDTKTEFMDIPNFFDFSKSPIYYIPKYKMSYSNKKRDFPKIREMIYQILSSSQYSKQRGMINTGSYDNAKVIFENAPAEIKKRLCMYASAKDKNDAIEKYTSSNNKILIGPTLVEGVDFPNDLCRFIIIVKIPYPNITSKMVKAKMQMFPKWYNSTTSNTIIQNIGRGVRTESDYCTTFILDGCFSNLYESTYDQYPPEIRERIKILNS